MSSENAKKVEKIFLSKLYARTLDIMKKKKYNKAYNKIQAVEHFFKINEENARFSFVLYLGNEKTKGDL